MSPNLTKLILACIDLHDLKICDLFLSLSVLSELSAFSPGFKVFLASSARKEAGRDAKSSIREE